MFGRQNTQSLGLLYFLLIFCLFELFLLPLVLMARHAVLNTYAFCTMELLAALRLCDSLTVTYVAL